MSKGTKGIKMKSDIGPEILDSEPRTPNSELKMQIAITGRGGQGVLFLTRILSECALDLGLGVIASETHGMAVRGGSVISTVKVGDFRGPLIQSGQADVMLVLDEGSMETFSHLLSSAGALYLNAARSDSYLSIDATALAAEAGSPLVANLVLLGFCLRHNGLFCGYSLVEPVTQKMSPDRFAEINLKALELGFAFCDSRGSV